MQDPVTPKEAIYKDEPYTGYWYYRNPKGAYSYYGEKRDPITGEYKYKDEPPYDEKDWFVMEGGMEKLGKPGYPQWIPTIPPATTPPVTSTKNVPESTVRMTPEKYTKWKGVETADELDQMMYNMYGAPGPVTSTKKELDLEDIYRRNMMLYGAQIPLQFRSLFQGIPVIPQMPYAATRAPALMSNVAPATAEARRQMGTAYSIGASLGKFGPAGLSMMPGVIASTVSEGGRMMGEIGTAEAARINAQEAANVEAANATAQARTAAELQRLQLQLGATSAVQAERTKAISNISEIFTRMAKEGMDYYALREGLLSREKAAGVDELLRQLGLTQGRR